MNQKDVASIRITDYDYTLPDEYIARYPLEKRDDSRLLLYDGKNISETVFHELPRFLPADTLMVFNDTRVIHARLLFRKDTGAHIEVFCLSPENPADYAVNFARHESCSWRCMVGNAKRWKEGVLSMQIESETGAVTLMAEKKTSFGNEVEVKFSWNDPSLTFSDVLEKAGKLPIPPYLNRPAEERDNETYQTVYSRVEGSVAAPTAGLHFTDEVMDGLYRRGIRMKEVTLHVGAGTFRPVKTETVGSHEMHTEFISVSRDTLQALYDNHNPLVVVGTTSMRTVESLYYIGRRLAQKTETRSHELAVSQWEPYVGEAEEIHPRQALENILRYMDDHQTDRLFSETQIMIAPGYRFHFADGLVTNFHQPQSTLLLLIAAFVGNDWRSIYNYALDHRFRFLSYGDSSLLWRKK